MNSSLEQTDRGNIAYYLDNQYHTLKDVLSESEFLFGGALPKKKNNSQSCLVCRKAINPLKCKKKINSLKFLRIALRMRTKETTLVNTRNLTTTATAAAQL